MYLGRVNQSVRRLLKKKKFNEIDTKLIKGIFLKKSQEKRVKKNIKTTFRRSHSDKTKENRFTVRKFKDFVVRTSVKDFGKRESTLNTSKRLIDASESDE